MSTENQHRPWVREHHGQELWHWYREATGPAACGVPEIPGTPYCQASKPQVNVCLECVRLFDLAGWVAMERNRSERPVMRHTDGQDKP